MPENKQPRVKTNEVTISGYLKENNLEVISSQRGNIIRGSVIIAVDELNSIRAQFNIYDKKYSGEPSKDYENVLKVLPEHTRSIAGYLSENPGATFAEAIKAADKVWVRGSFDEYTRLNEEGKEVVSIQVRAFSAGLKKESNETFKPRANFEVRTYIDEMTDELDTSGKPTGRVLITGLIPKMGMMVKIPFIAPATDGIAEFIKANYIVGGTVDICGNLVNVAETIEEEATVDTGYFGSYSKKQHFTRIINERVITGGSKKPFTEGMEGAISKTEVKMGLAKRKEKIDDNTSRSNSRGFSKPQTTSFATKSEDIDF